MSCMDDREVSKTAKYANINSSEYSIGLSNWRISFRSVSFVITVFGGKYIIVKSLLNEEFRMKNEELELPFLLLVKSEK